MAVITKLSAQKRAGRVNLFLDDRFHCGLADETVVLARLKVGQAITDEELSRLVLKSEEKSAFEKCARKLGTRMYAKAELAKFLKEKGFLQEVIFNVLKKLQEYGYVNDADFVKKFAESKRTLGKKAVEMKLKMLGVSSDDISAGLEDLRDEGEEEKIRKLFEKYVKNKEINKETQDKSFRFLASKGFDYDLIKKVLREKEEK